MPCTNFGVPVAKPFHYPEDIRKTAVPKRTERGHLKRNSHKKDFLTHNAVSAITMGACLVLPRVLATGGWSGALRCCTPGWCADMNGVGSP